MSDPSSYLVAYGPDANCTLAICSVKDSVYQYQPSVPANSIFIVLFALSMAIHIFQGIQWKTTWFVSCMVLGCVTEIIGYGGRLLLHQNPFSFAGFLMQIMCITLGPTFFAAGIYFTLSQTVVALDPTFSRIPIKGYYTLFITADIISLVLQASGGALSSTSSGASQAGVDVAVAGLSFQVFSLAVFIALCLDYTVRYRRARREGATQARTLPRSFKIFVAFLSVAILLILIRCAYRIDELSDGYDGHLVHDQGLFIGLEGVMIIAAAFVLHIGHPGPGLSELRRKDAEPPADVEGKGEPLLSNIRT